ncbi:MAG: hypothetical protein AAF939_18200, partial [Planctomycetota bacterium]
MDGYTAEIESRMVAFFNTLGEKDRRRYAAFEAIKLGHGGITYFSQLFGCDAKTIQQGTSEIENPPTAEEAKRQLKKTAAARRRKLLRRKSSRTS